MANPARNGLQRAARRGRLVIAAPVYAELVAAPGYDAEIIDRLLAQARITVDWELDEATWRLAAQAHRGYAERRRAQRGDPGPRRILADFLIGAHAVRLASALLTFDDRIYQAAFPALAVRNPDDE